MKNIKEMTDKELMAEARRLQREIKKHDKQFIESVKKSDGLQKILLDVAKA